MKGVLVLMVGVAATSALAERPARNAFINYSVHSVAELVKEVKNDPAVADRYERHFGMSKAEVIAYLGGLHSARLSHDEVFHVYSIPPDGHVKVHTQRLHRGERIFADQNGNPILMMICGNPLTKGPAVVTEHTISTPKTHGVPPTPINVNIVATPPPLAMAPPPQIPAELPCPPAPPTEVATTTYTTTNNTTNVSKAAGATVVVGALFLGISSGGHGHHGHTPPPVPEPASMSVLALGIGGLLMRRRKKSL